MQKTFSHYYKQNELCLKLVLLPFTLAVYAIKKLFQIAKRRYANRKH